MTNIYIFCYENSSPCWPPSHNIFITLWSKTNTKTNIEPYNFISFGIWLNVNTEIFPSLIYPSNITSLHPYLIISPSQECSSLFVFLLTSISEVFCRIILVVKCFWHIFKNVYVFKPLNKSFFPGHLIIQPHEKSVNSQMLQNCSKHNVQEIFYRN